MHYKPHRWTTVDQQDLKSFLKPKTKNLENFNLEMFFAVGENEPIKISQEPDYDHQGQQIQLRSHEVILTCLFVGRGSILVLEVDCIQI